MKNNTIPKQPHYKSLNPMIIIDTIPAVIPTEMTEWTGFGNRFVSGVSSFGFGGSNAHATVEKYHAKKLEPTENDRAVSVMTMSATSADGLQELATKYVDAFDCTDDNLADYCYTAATGRNHFAYRLAVVCHTAAELKDGLIAGSSGSSANGLVAGRTVPNVGIVMMFTGEGSQYVNMGADLYSSQPVFKDTIDECAKILAPHLDKDLLAVLYPKSGESSPIDERQYAQPALFAFEYALAQLWMSWGVEPTVVTGRDVGEYVAACLAGVFSLEDGLKLISARTAGSDSDFEKVASRITFADPYTTIILNHTGQKAAAAPDAAYFAAHTRDPAPFAVSVETATADGFQIFLEMGPDAVMLEQGRRAVSDPELKWLPSMSRSSAGWEVITETVAQMYVAGVPIKFDKYESEYARSKVVLPTYAFQRMRYWHDNCDLLNGTGDWSKNAGAGGVPLANLLYSVDWEKQPQAKAAEAAVKADGNWLILCDTQGYGDRLAAQIMSSGGTVAKLFASGLDCLSDADLARSVQRATSAFSGSAAVVDLWSLDAAKVAGLSAAALEESTVFGSGHAMYVRMHCPNSGGVTISQ